LRLLLENKQPLIRLLSCCWLEPKLLRMEESPRRSLLKWLLLLLLLLLLIWLGLQHNLCWESEV